MWEVFGAGQEALATQLDIDFFMLPLLVFGRHEEHWRFELKELINRYATFLRSAGCLPPNGSNPNIYLLVLDERGFKAHKVENENHHNPVLSLIIISPFNQSAEIHGQKDEWSITRYNEILQLVGMYLRITRWHLSCRFRE